MSQYSFHYEPMSLQLSAREEWSIWQWLYQCYICKMCWKVAVKPSTRFLFFISELDFYVGMEDVWCESLIRISFFPLHQPSLSHWLSLFPLYKIDPHIKLFIHDPLRNTVKGYYCIIQLVLPPSQVTVIIQPVTYHESSHFILDLDTETFFYDSQQHPPILPQMIIFLMGNKN